MLSFSTFEYLFYLYEPTYSNINDELHVAYYAAANKSMEKAAQLAFDQCEVDQKIMNNGTCHVSIDDTWQKRGHVSLNGVLQLVIMATQWTCSP